MLFESPKEQLRSKQQTKKPEKHFGPHFLLFGRLFLSQYDGFRVSPWFGAEYEVGRVKMTSLHSLDADDEVDAVKHTKTLLLLMLTKQGK